MLKSPTTLGVCVEDLATEMYVHVMTQTINPPRPLLKELLVELLLEKLGHALPLGPSFLSH